MRVGAAWRGVRPLVAVSASRGFANKSRRSPTDAVRQRGRHQSSIGSMTPTAVRPGSSQHAARRCRLHHRDARDRTVRAAELLRRFFRRHKRAAASADAPSHDDAHGGLQRLRRRSNSRRESRRALLGRWTVLQHRGESSFLGGSGFPVPGVETVNSTSTPATATQSQRSTRRSARTRSSSSGGRSRLFATAALRQTTTARSGEIQVGHVPEAQRVVGRERGALVAVVEQREYAAFRAAYGESGRQPQAFSALRPSRQSPARTRSRPRRSAIPTSNQSVGRSWRSASRRMCGTASSST